VTWTAAVTWLCRVVVGAAFILGGWAKSVDPYGTLYKMLEYLGAWGLHTVPHEPVVMAAVALGAFELTVGICVLTGTLRHSSVIAASAMMCAMLPLTAYIAAADPVSDCGCFGELLIISNTATLIKNIVLAACCVWLLIYNNRSHGIFHRSAQWLVVTATIIYALTLAAIGYNVQPVVDFRPYPLGTLMADNASNDEILSLVYEKNGERRIFPEDELPDSTWTYVGLAEEPAAEPSPFPVFNSDGEETDIFESSGMQLIFVVPDPGEHFLTRSRFANELAGYARRQGASVAAIVGTSTAGLREWVLLAAPEFDVYTADDTELKTLVRGNIAAVYLRDGAIVWKRNLASLDAELVEKALPESNALESISIPDDGRLARIISGIYITILLLLAAGTLVLNIRRK